MQLCDIRHLPALPPDKYTLPSTGTESQRPVRSHMTLESSWASAVDETQPTGQEH